MHQTSYHRATRSRSAKTSSFLVKALQPARFLLQISTEQCAVKLVKPDQPKKFNSAPFMVVIPQFELIYPVGVFNRGWRLFIVKKSIFHLLFTINALHTPTYAPQ